VNFDTANLSSRTATHHIGYGKSSLDRVIEGMAALQGRTVAGDSLPDRGFFYRSDQFSFARIGVPGLYMKGGNDYIGREPGYGKQLQQDYEARRYHQPSDEVQADWDYSGAVGRGRVLLVSRSQRPGAADLNPGDELVMARRRAGGGGR
jgi:Zn-dependent M28 family amino/carboxypeptidase